VGYHPGAHDLTKQANARISSLSESDDVPYSILLHMVDEGISVPPGGVPDLGFHAVITSDYVEAVGVCQAIKPVGDVKRPGWGVVDFVGPRPGAKYGARSPSWDAASDRELDRSAMLVDVGKLSSHP
jgi:hypothetical protein